MHLLNYHKITDPRNKDHFKGNNEIFKIKDDYTGLDNLRESFELELKGDVAANRYGVVVDADDDLGTVWQRIKDILSKSGYSNIPASPNELGTILKGQELPVVGIWIMPDNKLPGMIEDFIHFLGPQNDVLWPIAQDVVQKVIQTKCNFRTSYKSKACLHTWLAWQEEPGRPMGLAITKKYVDAKAPHAQRLVTWFRKVFDLERSA